jgi:hypothetical protein
MALLNKFQDWNICVIVYAFGEYNYINDLEDDVLIIFIT